MLNQGNQDDVIKLITMFIITSIFFLHDLQHSVKPVLTQPKKPTYYIL